MTHSSKYDTFSPTLSYYFFKLNPISKCDPFFQVWLISLRVTLFPSVTLFFQVWPISRSMKHFYRCDPFFKWGPFCKWPIFKIFKVLPIFSKCDPFSPMFLSDLIPFYPFDSFFTLGLHCTPGLQSAVCILPPVCSLCIILTGFHLLFCFSAKAVIWSGLKETVRIYRHQRSLT